MSSRTPTRANHERFRNVEGWEPVRSATGRAGRHHITYELQLHDGRTLRTRISHPPNKSDIGRSLFAHILRDQLVVNAAEFWACVDDGVAPPRGAPEIPTSEALPSELVQVLVTKAGFTDADVRAMTKTEAIAAAQAYWTGGNPTG